MIKIKILEKLNIRNEVNNYILINIYNTFNLINYNLYLGTIHINKYYFTLLVSDCEINNEFIISNNIFTNELLIIFTGLIKSDKEEYRGLELNKIYLWSGTISKVKSTNSDNILQPSS